MKIKELFVANFQIVAIIEGGSCPAEDFLLVGEKATEAYRFGMIEMLQIVAIEGLQDVPSKWFHEANKQDKIYEFIKGPLRLFFFKGENRQIAVCTAGVRKTGQKADKAALAMAQKYRERYFVSVRTNTLEVVSDETK